MNPISKQFEVLATRYKRDQFFRAEITLTLWYSLGVIALLVLFSFGTLQLFSRTIPTIPHIRESQEHSESLTEELFEGEVVEHLQGILIQVDLLLSVLVVVLCWLLAKRTIAPLRKAERRQKRFVADVAHEFRTPLAILRAGAEVALHKNDAETYQKMLLQQVSQVDELGVLLDDLLLLMQSEHAHDTSTRVRTDISALVAKQLELFTPLAEEREIHITLDSTPQLCIEAYPPDIQRLVINLVKNAIDYNREQGDIFVRVYETQNTVRLSVRDTGIGIGERDLPHIFERFYKADTSRAKKDSRGAGLGLSLVAEIVARNQGMISVRSEVGVGTEFIVEFPRA